MKAFSFRLEQALRWRAAQVDLEKAKVASAAAELARTRADLAGLRVELDTASAELTRWAGDGASLAAWPAWEKRMRARIQESMVREQQAESALAERVGALSEAHRRLRLIENLRASRKLQWTGDLQRELETFAGENFLGRLQSKRAGA